MGQVSLHHLCGKASLDSMQCMRPSWLCLQFKAIIHCVWGRSRISLGHVILLVHASGIFAAVEMFFVGIYLRRLVPDALQQRLAAFITAALTVAPNVQLGSYNRCGKKCSLKGEILKVRSWWCSHDLACERVSQYLIKLFFLAKVCTGSDLSTLCNFGHKLTHICHICDIALS